jgi:hypothetical protein
MEKPAKRIRPPGRDKRKNRIRPRKTARRWGVINPRRSWKKQDPGYARNRYLLQTYGITLDERNAMELAQMGQCAMCGRPPNRLEVDHDHKTGLLRELLCGHCNMALAVFRDDVEVAARLVELAAKYLDRHRQPESRQSEPASIAAKAPSLPQDCV